MNAPDGLTRRHVRGLAALATLATLAAAACAGHSGADPRAADPAPLVISIVATTDLHGHVTALPWLAGHVRVIREARARDGGAVVLVDAGDMFQGTLEANLTEGRGVIRAYNALGYAAVAVGNHEFDYGPEGPGAVAASPADNPRGALEARARESRFPLLAANVRRADGTPWTPDNVRASTIVEVRGVRIGLIGVTTAGTARATDPRNLVGLEIAPPAGAIAAEAKRLREAGATVVIVAAHAGAGCRAFDTPDDLTSCGAAQEVFDIARAIPRGLVDAIASGHTHEGVAHRVNGIAIVGAFAEGIAFSRVDLVIDRATGRPADARIFPPRFVCDGRSAQAITSLDAAACHPSEYEGRAVVYDPGIAQLVAPDVAHAAAVRRRPLGVVLATPFERRGRDESAVGNLMADMIRRARPRADAAVYNWGGLRADLPAGPLTYGRLYELLPFDNTVGSIVVTAHDLGRAVVRSLERAMTPSVSGLVGEVRCVAGGPVVAWRRPDGRAVPPDARLTVVTSSFLVADGDGLFEGLSGTRTIERESLRDVIADAFSTRGGSLRADDPAIFDRARPRLRAEVAMPFVCPPAASPAP